MALGTVLGALLFFFCLVIRKIYGHRRRNENAVIRSWPVVGMLPGLIQNFLRFHEFATEILRKSGGTFVFKGPSFLDSNFLITCDPSNIQHIGSTNFANYPKGPNFKEVFDVLGNGILNADSDLWMLQRKMFHLWRAQNAKFDNLFIARALQRKVVDDLIPFLDHVSKTGIQIDLQDTFRRMLTLDNAISLIFSLDVESSSFKLPKVEFQKAYECIDKVVFRRNVLPQRFWKLLRWLKIGGEREFARAQKIVDEFMYHYISLKRQELKNENKTTKMEQEEEEEEEEEEVEEVNYSDMISIYLEKKENPYSDKFLKDVALNLIAASKDTLNASLTWFFWLIATHPSVEAKILEEMKENLPTNVSDDMDLGILFCKTENLKKLVYLHAALLEMLRLYPPVPLNHKTVVEDDILPSGHYVKRNMRVLVSYYSTGRMEEIWGQDCLEFKPERWISTHGKLLRMPSHKFPVFHTGPRTCLGKDMVLVQMKVMAIWVLRNYTLQVVEGHPISPDLTITLYMKHGLKVKVSKKCA